MILSLALILSMLFSGGCREELDASTAHPFDSETKAASITESETETDKGEETGIETEESSETEPEESESFEESETETEAPTESESAVSEVKTYIDEEGRIQIDRTGYPTPEELKAQKVVYLTFDDGPSYLTSKVLDILDECGVKATFFVIHQATYNDGDDKFLRQMLKEISDRGHAIGVHAYNHKYSVVYQSLEYWKSDFMRMYNIILETTGKAPTAYRFPGGSKKNTSLELYKNWAEWKPLMGDFLHSMGIEYFDWNSTTDDGDASLSLEQILHNAFEGDAPITGRTVPVVLAHDGEYMENSVNSLKEVIERLKAEGYEFRTLDYTVPKIQQGKYWDY